MKKGKVNKVLSMVILVIGVVLIVRSLFVPGSDKLTTGMILGLSFVLYGAARLYTAAKRNS